MNKQIILENLRKLGLDEIESTIYFSLLEKGEKTPLELSRETNINRSKIYRYIESLTRKKLLETGGTNWGKKLKASPPENLELILYEKEQKLQNQKNLLPEIITSLNSYAKTDQQVFEIKHYKGEEGLKQMLWNELSAEDKKLLVFGYETRNEIVGKTFAEKVRMEQVLRKIKFYEIENATDQGNYWYTSVPNWDTFYESRHIDEAILAIQHQMAIYNDTVAILNWQDNLKEGIEIVSPFFAQMQRQIFWKFWEIANTSTNL